ESDKQFGSVVFQYIEDTKKMKFTNREGRTMYIGNDIYPIDTALTNLPVFSLSTTGADIAVQCRFLAGGTGNKGTYSELTASPKQDGATELLP
ncbi:MAG TPA: hypothetical protein VIR63_00950, partial [Pontiella sp.]